MGKEEERMVAAIPSQQCVGVWSCWLSQVPPLVSNLDDPDYCFYSILWIIHSTDFILVGHFKNLILCILFLMPTLNQLWLCFCYLQEVGLTDCILLVSHPIFLGFHLLNLNYFPGLRCSHIYHPGFRHLLQDFQHGPLQGICDITISVDGKEAILACTASPKMFMDPVSSFFSVCIHFTLVWTHSGRTKLFYHLSCRFPLKICGAISILQVPITYSHPHYLDRVWRSIIQT